MDVLIVTNGTITDLSYLKQLTEKNETILCADGAVRYLRQINCLPSVVMGDFDSISESDLAWILTNQVQMIQYEVRKDLTDTEIAVLHALEMNADVIRIIGAWGSRIDHSLGNLYLLKMIRDHQSTGIIVDQNFEIRLIEGHIVLPWRPGETVSFIPAGEIASGVTLAGFEYGLEGEEIRMGSSRGLSNVVIQDAPEVTVLKGSLFAVRNKKHQ
jgi:thiamine pyrophosphokinase